MSQARYWTVASEEEKYIAEKQYPCYDVHTTRHGPLSKPIHQLNCCFSLVDIDFNKLSIETYLSFCRA